MASMMNMHEYDELHSGSIYKGMMLYKKVAGYVSNAV